MAVRSECAKCGLVFTSVAAFDAHRTGSYSEPIYQRTPAGKQSRKIIGRIPSTRRCMTMTEIQALGMTQDKRGWWTLPKRGTMPLAQEQKEVETAR